MKDKLIRSDNPDITVVDKDVEIIEALTLPAADPTPGYDYGEGAIKRFTNGSLYSYASGAWIALAPVDTFATDTLVNLSGGKLWKGVYPTGTLVATAGKTAVQVDQEAASEPIQPSVSLSSSTTIPFNTTAISNALNFSYTILTLGASVASAVLEWRRNGTGSWTVLDNNTSHTSYTHTMTDSGFNVQPFNYRYTVIDSAGASNVAFLNITPIAYSNPSVSLSQVAVTLTSIETNAQRERGNINTNISGTITRISPLVDLVSYQLQYQVNGGSWVNIGTAQTISGGSATIPSTNHNNTGLNASATIAYRVVVSDTYTPTNPSGAFNSGAVSITFLYRTMYGPAASDPTDRTSGLSLGQTGLMIASGAVDLLLNAGTIYLNQYYIGPPNHNSITTAIDTSASGATVTYVDQGTFSFTDPTGATISGYHLWKRSQGTTYGSNHIHKLTTN